MADNRKKRRISQFFFVILSLDDKKKSNIFVKNKKSEYLCNMNAQSIVGSYSPHLFWDVNKDDVDMDRYAPFVIQRVLEYGDLNDWRMTRDYYGLDKIVACCQHLRTLDPRALSYICCISHTPKESYRCYHFAQSFPTPWNS